MKTYIEHKTLKKHQKVNTPFGQMLFIEKAGWQDTEPRYRFRTITKKGLPNMKIRPFTFAESETNIESLILADESLLK